MKYCASLHHVLSQHHFESFEECLLYLFISRLFECLLTSTESSTCVPSRIIANSSLFLAGLRFQLGEVSILLDWGSPTSLNIGYNHLLLRSVVKSKSRSPYNNTFRIEWYCFEIRINKNSMTIVTMVFVEPPARFCPGFHWKRRHKYQTKSLLLGHCYWIYFIWGLKSFVIHFMWELKYSDKVKRLKHFYAHLHIRSTLVPGAKWIFVLIRLQARCPQSIWHVYSSNWSWQETLIIAVS